jgi:hypothetical protein
MHALQEFGIQHPDITKEWYKCSNYLGFLSVRSENDLMALVFKAEGRGIRTAIFREPDIGDEVTAIALEPSPVSKKLCANLPLALSG